MGQGLIATGLYHSDWHIQHSCSSYPDGHLHVRPAEADSYNQRRSRSSEDDDDHAVDVYLYVLVTEQRLGPVLANQ